MCSMFSRSSDGANVENSPQRKSQRTENHPPNVVDDFPTHEYAKNADNTLPANDHDMRYAIILEAITKTSFATREEISRASLITSAANDRIEYLVGKLTVDFEKLQEAVNQGIKGCNDQIEKQKANCKHLQQQMPNELEQVKNKPVAVPRLGRVAFAPCLILTTKFNDPSYYDSTIVRLNSSGIVGRDKVWEIAAKLLAAANINETEVELLPKAPLANIYRLKLTTRGPTASSQARQLVESLRFGKGTGTTWKEVFVTLPDGEATKSICQTGPLATGNR